MDWLNYHHLLYFWTVVQEGGIAAASRKLHVGRPSISMQLKSLETFIGSPLFDRRGRYLKLTETGKLVHGYAEDIFRSGRELVDAVRGRTPGKTLTFRVGIANVMAKLVAFELLEPALDVDEDVTIECREDEPSRLFAELAVHELDLVLSDIPLAPGLDVKAYNHVMGESTTTLFASTELARRLKRGFPGSLEGAPFLLPSKNTAIRHQLERWLEEEDLRPKIVGEFEDSALMKVFGQAGRGVFPAPTVVAEQICKKYGVRTLGELEDVRERFYAISPERKIKHPAVVQIVEHAKRGVFGTATGSRHGK
jgi:LysR family transcriptional activator of nhaA